MFALTPLPSIGEIQRRLEFIFPEGISDRSYVVRESTAKTVFVFFYINAIQGEDIYLAPQHVYRFTDQQCERQTEDDRIQYIINCKKKNFVAPGLRWYADNSREQVRDENIKDGLVCKGAVIVDATVPTTSNKGRYALQRDFAGLFLLNDQVFEEEARKWQTYFLSARELAKVRIMRERHASEGVVSVEMPNGERRNLKPGDSSQITKAVIEDFAPRFLEQPAVLWISESGNKVVLHDDRLMRDLGLPIDQQRLLPDLVLADLGRDHTLIIFVEIVHSDGPITEARKTEIISIAEKSGYTNRDLAFISAFKERNAAALKKRLSGIATDTLIWCVAEPDVLIWLGEKQEIPFKPTNWKP